MIRALTSVAVFVAAAALPLSAQAADGSRMPAGGNLMSSYVTHEHHDPRSLWSQQNGTGQILGSPNFHENGGAQRVSRQPATQPHWASGTSGKRGAR